MQSLVLTACVAVAANAQQAPRYVPKQQVTGVIRTWGSPQMSELLRAYEDGFRKVQPGVAFEDDLKSTITAVAGVYTARADIGLLGREIWPIEEQAFESVEGHPATVIDIATASYDVPKATFALMVFVPKSNPISSLSVAQLERIFGRGDAQNRVHTWGDLGLTGAWAHRPVHLYGFASENDKSQIFAQLVFRKGERWNCDLHEYTNIPGGADAGELIVHAVSADPDGIGISNVFYASPNVKALPLSTATHPSPIDPIRENVASRAYPLTRAIYMVVNVDSVHPPNPSTKEFLRFVLSQQGRDAVIREGNYIPLPEKIAAAELKKLDTH
jgi:phosphate transport system substrate-binding protein